MIKKVFLLFLLLILCGCSIKYEKLDFDDVLNSIFDCNSSDVYLYYKNEYNLDTPEYTHILSQYTEDQSDQNINVKSYYSAIKDALSNLNLEPIDETEIDETLRIYHFKNDKNNIYIYTDNKIKVVNEQRYFYRFQNNEIYNVIKKVIQGYTDQVTEYENVDMKMVQFWDIYHDVENCEYDFRFIINNNCNKKINVSYNIIDDCDANYVDYDTIDIYDSKEINITTNDNIQSFILKIGEIEKIGWKFDLNHQTGLVIMTLIK